MRKIHLLTFCILYLSLPVFAQGWRGIKPIESTCKDVRSKFGSKVCSEGSVNKIFRTETVTLIFAGSCSESDENDSYNVPPGTLINIFIIPHNTKRLFISDLHVPKSKFQKKIAGDHLGVFEYVSVELGMSFNASKNGQILDMWYFPAAKYNYLRCSSRHKEATNLRTKKY